MKVRESVHKMIKGIIRDILNEAPGDEEETPGDDAQSQPGSEVPPPDSPAMPDPVDEPQNQQQDSNVNIFGTAPQPDLANPLPPAPPPEPEPEEEHEPEKEPEIPQVDPIEPLPKELPIDLPGDDKEPEPDSGIDLEPDGSDDLDAGDLDSDTLGDEPSIPPAMDLPGEPDSPNDINTEFAGTITPLEVKDLIKRSKGKFFTVSFIKKDGTPRIMNARLGVKAYLKGGELPYDPEEKGLIPVFDVQKKEYRVIPIDRIYNLKIGNNEYKVR